MLHLTVLFALFLGSYFKCIPRTILTLNWFRNTWKWDIWSHNLGIPTTTSSTINNHKKMLFFWYRKKNKKIFFYTKRKDWKKKYWKSLFYHFLLFGHFFHNVFALCVLMVLWYINKMNESMYGCGCVWYTLRSKLYII